MSAGAGFFVTIEVFRAREGRTGARRREPVRLGVPIAAGVCRDSGRVALRDHAGQSCPLQARALEYWPDGSVRWLLLDFQAEHDGLESPAIYTLDLQAASPSSSPRHSVHIADDGDALSIDTGAARFRLRRGGRFPFEEVLTADAPAIDPARTRLDIEDDHGRRRTLTVARIETEDAGPLRVVVRIDAWAGDAEDNPFVQVIARLHFFAESATVRFELTLRNPRPAEHRGGFWELGDKGSVFIRDVSLVIALPPGDGPVGVRCTPDFETPPVEGDESVELFQASSGGANWSSRNHVNRHGVVPLAFSGYRLRADGAERFGRRATPVLTASRGGRHLSIAMPHFWQNFPKAMEASGDELALRLFPHQHGDFHELQGGEQKTHVLFVAFDTDIVSDEPLAWARAPLFARASVEHYGESGAVPYLLPAALDRHQDYVDLVNAALDGADTFERKREIIDEYGWRHFGDLYADHEAAFYSGPAPVISHYNNQYDAIGGCACQFMRSGDPRWWHAMAELASHVRDIDVYHTSGDKSAYNHGLLWHTAHYVDAGRSTHRSYPRAKGVSGGGPSPEHNYSTGLVLHYYLTGEVASRDAAIGLARWVVEMDDGAKTVFRWLARGYTGVASATYSPLYHGPGRGAGNSIAALLDGHRLTGDRGFLDKAEALIRRCIHPDDAIERRELLDSERRWSYTVFLHVLGRYLDGKVLRNELDAGFAYARQALLAYARWMAIHERPYLDRAETLEYPTETWAAQELWKSEVFTFAAKYAADSERPTFLERARFFFHYAMSTLQAFPTRTFTRPLVLLLSRGSMLGYVEQHAEALAAPAGEPHAIEPPTAAFVPQRERAKRRAIVIAAALPALGALIAMWWLMR